MQRIFLPINPGQLREVSETGNHNDLILTAIKYFAMVIHAQDSDQSCQDTSGHIDGHSTRMERSSEDQAVKECSMISSALK